MNAVRWQCDLQASRSARALNVTLFVLCSGVLFSLRWPEHLLIFHAPFQVILWLECWRNERRLSQRRGRLVLDEQGNWLWRGVRWQPIGRANWLPCGVLLVMRNPQGKRWRLWLMHDNLPPYAWRTLRAGYFLRDGPAAR